MNLLNSVFNYDEINIMHINKKYLRIMLVVIFLTILLLIIKKDNYYSNTYSYIDDGIVLFVENKYINKIKDSNSIIIDNVNDTYSINEIVSVNDDYMVKINLSINVHNGNGTYKVFLGKEKLFDYIIRIISS